MIFSLQFMIFQSTVHRDGGAEPMHRSGKR